MKILLIEDMSGFAKPIKEFLEAKGHIVTWVIGATSLDSNRMIGITASPAATAMEDSWDGNAARLVDLDLVGFELALVDGGLIGPVNDGIDFVRALSALGVVCVAISGAGAGNPRLLQAGARIDVPKEFVILAFRAQRLDPTSAVTDPEGTARAVRSHTEALRAEVHLSRQRQERFDYGIPFLAELT